MKRNNYQITHTGNMSKIFTKIIYFLFELD